MEFLLHGVWTLKCVSLNRLFTAEPVKGLLPTDPLRSVALKKYLWAGGILTHWHTVM